jgi:hypothetical protein
MSDTIVVTLATFTFPAEAYLLLSKLQENDIECSIADENIVTADPLLTAAVGGIKVKIFENDSEKAIAILNEIKQAKQTEEKKLNEKWSKDYEPANTYCPQCESYSVFKPKASFLESVTSVFSSTKLYCADCGNVWEE